VATELHIAHKRFTWDFKSRAGTRAALTQTLARVTIPAAVEATVDRGAGNRGSYAITHRYGPWWHRTGSYHLGHACPRDSKRTRQTPGNRIHFTKLSDVCPANKLKLSDGY